MYVNRLLSDIFAKARAHFPAILVTGPRQAGKTTFLQHEVEVPFDYISFDDPVERSFAIADPNGFLKRFSSRPVILDEIQYVCLNCSHHSSLSSTEIVELMGAGC